MLIKLNIRAKVLLDPFTQLKVIYLKTAAKIAAQLMIFTIKFFY